MLLKIFGSLHKLLILCYVVLQYRGILPKSPVRSSCARVPLARAASCAGGFYAPAVSPIATLRQGFRCSWFPFLKCT